MIQVENSIHPSYYKSLHKKQIELSGALFSLIMMSILALLKKRLMLNKRDAEHKAV